MRRDNDLGAINQILEAGFPGVPQPLDAEKWVFLFHLVIPVNRFCWIVESSFSLFVIGRNTTFLVHLTQLRRITLKNLLLNSVQLPSLQNSMSTLYSTFSTIARELTYNIWPLENWRNKVGGSTNSIWLGSKGRTNLRRLLKLLNKEFTCISIGKVNCYSLSHTLPTLRCIPVTNVSTFFSFFFFRFLVSKT